MTVACSECEKSIAGRDARALTCSQACRDRRYRRRMIERARREAVAEFLAGRGEQ